MNALHERAAWRWTVTGLAVLAAVLLACFVWPTRFKEEVTYRAPGGVSVLRTDRLTGHHELIFVKITMPQAR